MKKIYLPIGKLSKIHGLKGDIFFFPLPWIIDFRLSGAQKFFYRNENHYLLLEIEKAKFYKGRWLLKFVNWKNANQAELFQNRELFVSENDFVQFSALWYWPHLIGYQIKYKTVNCGELNDLFVSKAHLLGEIKTETGEKYLMPLIDEYLKHIIEKEIHVTDKILELKNTLLQNEKN